MTEKDERIEDAVLEAELAFNERVLSHPKFGRIRLRRPTPRKELAIAEAYRRSQQRDLFDDSIKSRTEIAKRAAERGMWSEDMESQLAEMQLRFAKLIQSLHTVGYESLQSVMEGFLVAAGALTAKFAGEENAPVREAITRLLDLSATPTAKDRKLVMDAAKDTEVDRLLEETDSLRAQVELLQDFAAVRAGVDELFRVQSELFSNTIEGRARRAQEFAQIYHCIEDAKTGKPLWPTEEAMLDEEQTVIAGLQTELSCFFNGVTEEYRDMVGRFGFLQRVSVTEEQSDDSPAHPQPNSDGELQENPQETSSPV